jgi:hypothetical protein
MRQTLLAGVALIGVTALVSEARAQSATTTPPPTVFPETTTPGKLDGAAPGSVTANIGFQMLNAFMGMSGSGATGQNARAAPQFLEWFHFFPSFDYVNPSGIHFGVTAEIRDNTSNQTSLNTGNTFYVFSATSYVSSDRFGKFAVGTPNGALDDLGVGTGDDFGDGLFYSWYGPPNAPAWAMADSYDGDAARQKVLYETPTLAGFKFGVSWQPTDVALDASNEQIIGDPCPGGALAACAHPTGLARNRIELAAQYKGTFGAIGVKGNVGYVNSGVEANGAGLRYQNVSYGNGGAVVTINGVEIEGSISGGRFNATGNNVAGDGTTISSLASPGDPALVGAKDSLAYVGGLGYNSGPFGVGIVYYGMNFDDSEATGVLGKIDTVDGEGLGGSYVVGPGVTLQFDAYRYDTHLPTHTTRGDIIAVAAQYAF